uniref:Uncharacterized protein n=1 Tax=Hanusia phi TaxID=3032 RepID=A0A7S0EP20_9CRYP
MDEEDMQLLRSKGVKKIADFHRIADVKSLQLPPVTEVKMRELLAGLGKDARTENVLSRVRKSLDALMSFLPLYPSGSTAKETNHERDAEEEKEKQTAASKRKRGSKELRGDESEDREAEQTSKRSSRGSRQKEQNGALPRRASRSSFQSSRGGQAQVLVKEEAVFEMSLRPKRFKKGFYSLKDIEDKAWKRGRGTRDDPVMLD